MNGERVTRIGAACAAVLAALGTLILDGDLEVTLFMVAAVVSGLVCFDASMERRLQAFVPWVLLSLAPVLKTVPDVWFTLRPDSGLLPERYDHAGTLMFGLCMFAATATLARPSPTLGSSVAGFDAAVILGSAVTGAMSGASVAFLFDTGFGSVTASRLLETPTWFVLSGILAAVVGAASHSQKTSLSLNGVFATAAATSALLAISVAGRDLDRGWWALTFAGLAVSAVAGRGDLGHKADRNRPSNAPVVVALIVGLVAAASAIVARSDRTAWSPGWALLGLISLAMFGLALASKPPEDQGEGHTASDSKASGPLDIGLDDDRRARRARARALTSLENAATPTEVRPGDLQSLEALETHSGSARAAAPAEPVVPAVHEPVNGKAAIDSSALIPDSGAHARANAAAPTASAPAPATSIEPDHDEVAPAPEARSAPQAVAPAQALAATASLSDGNLVAVAKAAAAVRTAPPAQRHSLAPLAQAHHFDPSTGLLSSAGLQHAIARAFDVPRRAGHVTMLMFTIRDIDQIERQHGRLASAAVTREVAERVNMLLPDGTGARFARAAYAVIFVGDRSNTDETTQWLARILLQLRAPVEGGTLGDKIDVVAGMAQCYESEDAANFVKRANSGLARAVQLVEPTLVAMP